MGAAALGAAIVLSGAFVATSAPAPAVAAPGDACDSDNLYGIVGYPQNTTDGHFIMPSQLMEYTLGTDGNVASYSEFSEIINGVPGGDQDGGQTIPLMDGLGLGADCSFYFTQNTDFLSTTPQVDLYRYNPAEGDTPVLMQKNFSMNSPTASNVNAGAVSPSGEYYFGYFSRQQPSDPSDANTEALRLHLYRYVYDANHDPESNEQPNLRSGEVAHIDAEVPAEAFKDNSGTPVPTYALHGDMAFDQDGNLTAFVSSELTFDQASIVLPKELFDGIDGTWKKGPNDPYIPVPRVNTDTAAYTQHELQRQDMFMGTAYRADGRLQQLSLAPNASGKQYDAGFSQLNPTTLERVAGTYSQLEIPAKNVSGSPVALTYPMDLASNNYAGTLSSSLSVDELLEDTDVFSLVATDDAGTELGSVSLTPGELTADLAPVLTTPGTYTVTQKISANAEYYSTKWSCSTGDTGVDPVTGSGLVATVTAEAGETVSCAFSNTLNRVIPDTPTIAGDLTVGSTVTAEAGAGWGPAGVELSYQWLRDGQPIEDATRVDYVLTDADLGADITVVVNGKLAGHVSAEKASAPVIPVKSVTPVDPVTPDEPSTPESGAGKQQPGTKLAVTGSDLATYGVIGGIALLLGVSAVTASMLRKRKNAN